MRDRHTCIVVYGGVAGLLAGVITTFASTAAAAPLIECVSSDNGDPDLLEITFTPAVIDVTTGPAEVTVRAAVADTGGPGDPSGVARVEVELDRRGYQDPELKLEVDPGGDWVTTLTIGQGERPDRWRVTEVTLRDEAKNEGLYGYGGEDLAKVPGIQVLTIVNDTPDLTPPEVLSAGLTPDRVNTVHGTRYVRFTVRAKDTGSGVAHVGVGLYRERGAGSAYAVLHRVAATPRLYRGRITFGPWAQGGRWQVGSIGVEDRASNSRLVQSFHALQRLGVGGGLTVLSRHDNAPPRISHFSLAPEVADIRKTDQTVTVSMRVRDHGAGVRRVVAYLDDPLELNPLMRLRLVSGTLHDGVWAGTIRLRQCPAQSGRMRAFVFAADWQGNQTGHRPAQLRELGLPWKVQVIARPDAQINPWDVTNQPRVPPEGPLTLRFPETVNGITADSTLVRRVPRREGAAPGPAIPGTWTCTDEPGNPTDCALGNVRKAWFNPTDPLATGQTYAVVLNPEHSLAVTDLAGNPYDRDEYWFNVRAP